MDKKGNKNSKWVCSGKIKGGRESCPSFAIYEEEIKPLIFEVFKDTKDVSKAMIDEYEKMYLGMTSDQKIAEKIEDTERKIEVARKKKSKLLELAALDSITAEDFKELSAQCNDELAAFARELEDLREQQTSREDFRANMERIKKVLHKAEEDCKNGEITKEFIDAFVDKIFVTVDGDTARLDIKIFTGESCEKYLQKLKRGSDGENRAGHIFANFSSAIYNFCARCT